AWAAAHAPIVLTPEARNHLVQTLSGRAGLTRSDSEAILDDPDRLIDAPPQVLAELYRDGAVDAPGLSAALTDDVRRVLGPTAVDVWAVPSRDVGR
ncbi:MAG: hypothetical protein ACTHN0_19885, partial [Aquihabitans sp.]